MSTTSDETTTAIRPLEVVPSSVRRDDPPIIVTGAAAPGLGRSLARPQTRRMRSYVARAAVLDLIMVTVAAVVAYVLDPALYSVHIIDGDRGLGMLAGLVVLWAVVLLGIGGYDSRYLGVGTEEYKRVAGAGFIVLGLASTISYFFEIDKARRFLVLALVAGFVLTLLGRFVLRTWLGRARANGRFLNKTVVIGQGCHPEQLAERLRSDVHAGFQVVGMWQPPAQGEQVEEWLDRTEAYLADVDADAVAVAELSGIDADLVRRLSWRLEGPRIDLLVAPGLSDLAGPRLSIRPASGLPLIHLDEPQLNGPKALLKRAVDVTAAAFLLVVLLPGLLLVALAVKLTSPGRVFYVQQRVGQYGETFSFWKFRTMVTGAHAHREEVIGAPDEDISERYRCDPRITRVGRVLRRWSIDELPQLVQVLTGHMSMVGPRPLLVEEMQLLVDSDHRRHMTKPGLTGLWQVSGRKDVEWEERMRLDLWYVENWSPALDFVIVLRTARAIVTGHGAY